MRSSLVAGLLACAIAAQDATRLQSPERPFESLFDGKTLAGWRGDPAIWSVRDGCVVGSTVGQQLRANTFLVLDGRDVANFELVLLVRLEGDNNSGVQYRSRELDGPGFRVGGYQCDLHGKANYTAMLYDERGAGIVAEHGQFVRWRDDGRTVLGSMRTPRPVDLAAWHRLRIVARGDLLWHEWDGATTTAVQDQRAAAPRSGVLALQVHAGPPMTVSFRDVQLRTWPDAESMAAAVPLPPALVGLLRVAETRRERPAGPTPMWIWDRAAGADEELFFRRAFHLAAAPTAARLAVACDNRCRIYVNGEKVGEGDDWQAPVVLDVTPQLRAGDNVVAVHGWNEGGPAALAAHMSWQLDGKDHQIVTDKQWTAGNDDPDGWNAPGFSGQGFAPVRELAAMGQVGAAWTSAHAHDALGAAGDPFAAQVAVVDPGVDFAWRRHGRELASGLSTASRLPDAAALRLLEVPRSLGSWVSLTAGPAGELYAGAQGGGLFRVTPARAAGETSTIERVPVTIGGTHGLLWFRDSLYAVVNGKQSGLYRLTDTDGDRQLDRVELLMALEGEGEHGPHSVVVAPDGVNLLVVAGNQTKLPELAGSRVPRNWAEDRLLPRLDDPNPYWEGHSPPGGWICQVDPDGKRWELLCCGFRNPYDLVVLPNGGVVTYDSDMEWDMGLPWYRPTRLLALRSGVDYGWRIGSAKWPADYPEAPVALADVGPGSPTGMDAFGPQHYLALDWTFGTVLQNGQPLLVGEPLPLTDVHGRYLLTGGRGLPSSLLYMLPDRATESRVRGDTNWPAPDVWSSEETRSVAAILDAPQFDAVAARIALERQPVAAWREGVLAAGTRSAPRVLAGLLALARQGEPADLEPVLQALGKLPFAPLPHRDRIAYLRAHALALLRLGPANEAQLAAIGQRLLPLFPTGNERQDQDLAELLAYVDAPGVLDKLVPALRPLRSSPVPAWAAIGKQGDVYGSQYAGVIDAMAAAMPPIGQLAIADALRLVKSGWTLEQRSTYFTFLGEARQKKGGASYDGFVKKMVDAVWATCSAAEQQALADIVGKAKADLPKFVAKAPQGPGRDWQMADIDGVLRDGPGTDLARGHNLFHAASCASCHYFAGEGGNHGPDLTSLGNKFTARDVLEAILAPSQVVSEQYVGQVLTKKDGSSLFGFVVKGFHGDTEVYEVMPALADAELVRVPIAEVQKVERSPLSPMPTDLVDRLSRDELRDLVGFLLSRGRGLSAR